MEKVMTEENNARNYRILYSARKQIKQT